MEATYLRQTDVVLYLKAVDNAGNWEEAKRDLKKTVERLRELKNLADDAPLPAFLVVRRYAMLSAHWLSLR